MQQNNLEKATRGSAISIAIYLILATIKIASGYYFKSESLSADGFNNFTDIIGSLSVFIGLNIAKKPADKNHYFGHSKFETIASFITSVIMVIVGLEITINSLKNIIAQHYEVTDSKAAFVSLFSISILFITYRYITSLYKKTDSLGLKATATDMRNDLLISIGTLIGTLFVQLGFPIIDTLLSLVVGCLIIYSGFNIFKESTFVLSDGFDETVLAKYYESVAKHPKIHNISNLRARLSGNKIYVDITIEIDAHLTVIESHYITEEVERILSYNYQVDDCDVHVEPFHK